jgi:hypothetical protein
LTFKFCSFSLNQFILKYTYTLYWHCWRVNNKIKYRYFGNRSQVKTLRLNTLTLRLLPSLKGIVGAVVIYFRPRSQIRYYFSCFRPSSTREIDCKQKNVFYYRITSSRKSDLLAKIINLLTIPHIG